MKKKKENSKSRIREKINKIYEENEYANLVQNKNRSRSITIGTAFGGAVEISMRGDYHTLWAILQPVEAVEIIEQIAAGIGLQVAMRPKQDFAAWRGWNVDADDRYWAGAAPWQIENMAESQRLQLKEELESRKLIGSDNNLDEEQDKLNEEHLIQQKIKVGLHKEASAHIKNLIEERNSDSNEFLELSEKELYDEEDICNETECENE
jgi:hypothetical protein